MGSALVGGRVVTNAVVLATPTTPGYPALEMTIIVTTPTGAQISTLIFTSRSTATEQPPRPTTVITSARARRRTEAADVFLGAFLPPLLAVVLIIPLRIIHLSAELYQPFQTLASSVGHSHGHGGGGGGGDSGAETLLLAYAGMLAGGLGGGRRVLAVPALSGAMVVCASLAAPLAAEAVRLRERPHDGDGDVALGVFPAPAHALVALLVVVAVLLAVVGALVGRWGGDTSTGFY
ncbi:hypothetical protein VTG60DRAFT_3445 [Thermothelomyces hinnuleus]